ncbi:MAG TPA: HPF/RaiA family ribosome-associated protein [Bryobacteraceae bacterium]|nr:HPF/RaiA family ribosome-associated protein [Bryobacteraceae bacterium]
MIDPLEIEFENVKSTEPLQTRVRQELAEFEKYYGRLLSCRVEIRGPEHERRGSASNVTVRIDFGLRPEDVVAPEFRELAVKPESEHMEVTAEHKDPEMAVHAAFNDARRRLKDVLIAR